MPFVESSGSGDLCMNKFRRFVPAVSAFLVMAPALPVQAAVDNEFLAAYGGAYQVDCANPQSATATVHAESLEFRSGDTRIASSSADVAHGWFGNSPPDDFLAALLAELPGGKQMLWLLYQDDSGLYLTIEDDSGAAQADGSPVAGLRFYRCAGAPARATAPAEPQRQYELHELSASGILMYPGAKAAYYRALGPLIEEQWLKELDGPSSENTYVVVAGAEYLRGYCCKNHDCYENNTVFLYSARQDLVYGLVYQDGTSTLIGEPPPEVAKDLERLWQELFRSNPD